MIFRRIDKLNDGLTDEADVQIEQRSFLRALCNDLIFGFFLKYYSEVIFLTMIKWTKLILSWRAE